MLQYAMKIIAPYGMNFETVKDHPAFIKFNRLEA